MCTSPAAAAKQVGHCAQYVTAVYSHLLDEVVQNHQSGEQILLDHVEASAAVLPTAGFASRAPEAKLSDLLNAGITTVVGVTGTDSVTRSQVTHNSFKQ